jgi:P pilus assembly chaperone PapD
MFYRLLVIFFTCFSTQLWAASISTHRVFLDKSQKTSSVLIFNKEIKYQDCRVYLRNYIYGAEGQITEVKGKFLPANAANKFIRLSPKKFRLSPNAQQNVNISSRRTINQVDGEYRSILAISCVDEISKERANKAVVISPILIHNIPVIVRIGKLEAQVAIKNVSVKDNAVNFDVFRQGDRSVYGDLVLFNTLTNKIEDRIRGVSLYPGTKSKNFTLKAALDNQRDMKLSFIENPAYGGSIKVESAILN